MGGSPGPCYWIEIQPQQLRPHPRGLFFICLNPFAALWKYKAPILIVWTKGAHISRLVTGFVENNSSHMLMLEIEEPEDIVGPIGEAIQKFGILCSLLVDRAA